jgi:vanillate/4-hydroxybenzoate decarboxylase subunit D
MPAEASLPTISVERQAIEGICPSCGGAGLERYPVLSEGGWFLAVKCPHCLGSVSRERWNRLGYVVRLEDSL